MSPPTRWARLLQPFAGTAFSLQMITNRGVKVWPQGMPETFCTDHWRCRFVARAEGASTEHGEIVALLANLAAAGLDFVKTQHLYTYDGVPGYSLGHGQ